MKYTIAILAGHNTTRARSFTDKGAHYAKIGKWEGDLNYELAELIAARMHALCGVAVYRDPDDAGLRETIQKAGLSTMRKGILLDIHFNGGEPSRNGCEVFVAKDAWAGTHQLARKIQDTMVDTMRIHDRGVKPEDQTQHGSIYSLSSRHVNHTSNVLIEVCFPISREWYEDYAKNQAELVHRIAAILVEELQQRELI